jgi:hypothetical protein
MQKAELMDIVAVVVALVIGAIAGWLAGIIVRAGALVLWSTSSLVLPVPSWRLCYFHGQVSG